MNFQLAQAQYRRYFEEHQAWVLLRADNAPYIFAFIETLSCFRHWDTKKQVLQILSNSCCFSSMPNSTF